MSVTLNNLSHATTLSKQFATKYRNLKKQNISSFFSYHNIIFTLKIFYKSTNQETKTKSFLFTRIELTFLSDEDRKLSSVVDVCG